MDQLVAERLKQEAAAIQAEGWHWIDVAPDVPYGHTFGLRQLRGEEVPRTAGEAAEQAALQGEYEQLAAAHAQDEGVPDDVDRRLTEIEARLAALDERPLTFDPAERARGGAIVSIDRDGVLVVERGYVRPEDEAPVAPAPAAALERHPAADPLLAVADPDTARPAPIANAIPNTRAQPEPEEEEEEIKPLPDRLLAELTTHRTLALRHALGEHPDIAFLAALHALCLKLFYAYAQDTCLELDLKQVALAAQAPGLGDSEPGKAIRVRHQGWTSALPREAADLWDALAAADGDTRQRLFAHCVGASVNAVHDEAWNRRPRALAHADRLAGAVGLDMVAAGWTPTAETYLGRVTKARILQAVRESQGEPAAQRIAHLKKSEMVEQAQDLLAGSRWLPEPLRTPGQASVTAETVAPVADRRTGGRTRRWRIRHPDEAEDVGLRRCP